VKAAPLVVLLVLTSTAGAAGGSPVHVSMVGQPLSPVARTALTVRLAVRPASFRGDLSVIASGATRFKARATGGHGSYRARLVFPTSGRWTLAARAGATTSRLGTVRVRPQQPRPLTFSEPTSIDLEPAGTLLLVENSLGRVLRVDPQTGGTSVLVTSLDRPYAIVRARSGSIFISSGNLLRRVDANGPVTVAQAGQDIGPLAAAPNGDIYYATATQVFRLVGGAGSPVRIGGTSVAGGAGDGGSAVNAQFSSPHGLAIAGDGALLISDAGNDRVRRLDLTSGIVTTLAQVETPHGIDVAADGTIYVIDSQANRVVQLSASGERLRIVGPAFGLPYDVEVADDGAVYVLEAGQVGYVRRIASDGTVTTVSQR
jgi:sugar lactone lactonase YvrE